MIPIRDETQKVLSAKVKKHAIVDFFETGIVGMTTAIDGVFGRQWPKAKMITKDLVDFEKLKIAESEDVLLAAA